MEAMLLRAFAAVVLLALSFGTGWKVHAWKGDSEALLIERTAAASAEKAGDRVVTAISKLRPRYVTINNEVKRVTDQEPRYRADECMHTDPVWMRLSDAYEAIGGPPLDRAGVPPAAPASGPEPAGDNGSAH